MFLFLFNPEVGIINDILDALFNIRPRWLDTPTLTFSLVTAAAIWKNLGYNIVFYLAALRNPCVNILGHPVGRIYNHRLGLSADWARLAMVQTIINSVQYLDPVVDDWAHIKSPTLVFGGADDALPGSAAIFRERMRFIADTVPNGKARLLLIPGLGHVPHMEAPEKTLPPLAAFLKEGL